MIPEYTYSRIASDNRIADKDKEAILDLFKVSDSISFGKIGPRQEGYIWLGVGYPRATNVLQMDGMRAAALMEWAKTQVANRIELELVKKLHDNGEIGLGDIGVACKEGLADPDRQKNEAADVGTFEHDNIENWLNGVSEYTENEILRRFVEIWSKERVVLVCTEMPLIYRDQETGHGFGGKLDILAYKDGKFYIYDNKTSKSVHNSYGQQVSAYKNAVEQMSGGRIKIEKCKIIHLPDLTTLKEWQLKQYKKLGSLIECKNLDEAFVHYKILLEQYYRRNNKYF